MKKIVFSILLSLGVIFGYSSEDPKTDIPSLVLRTLKFDLKETDFIDSGFLFLNIDTLSNKKSVWDYDYRQFSRKKDFLNEFFTLEDFLKNIKIKEFFFLNNNSLYDSPEHWVLRIDVNNNTYDIDWWFCEYDPKKLKGITISLIKKGNV